MNILLGYPQYIMSDSHYYDIPKKDVGAKWAEAGFFCEIVVLLSNMAIGPTFDILGRKWPLVITQIICGCCLILVPIKFSSDPNYHNPYFQVLACRTIGQVAN